MKGIQTPAPETEMLNQSVSTSYAPILQGILDGIGWKSPSTAIYKEQSLEIERSLSLKEAELLYQQNPNATHQKNLLSAIDEQIDAAKAELRRAKHLQKEAHQTLMKKTTTTGSLVSRFGSWLMESAQYAFDSTPEQLVKRYSKIAKNCKADIKKWSRYRNDIISSTKTSQDNEQIIFNSYSISQNDTCYPSSFNISDLNAPRAAFRGFVLNGPPFNGYYSYCGGIVKGIGDINADRIDDFFVDCLISVRM